MGNGELLQGTLIAITGDSLGSHAMGGFSENFSNNKTFRLFPLLIEDLIDTKDSVWEIVLFLKVIVQITVSPKITHEQIAYLIICIEECLEGRATLFPEKKLKPKHHFLSHYPELVLAFGPLVRVCTLCFKKCCRWFQNFKHVTKMLTHQHQLLQAYYSTGSLFPDKLQCFDSLPFYKDSFSDKIVNAIAMETSFFNHRNTDVSYNLKIYGT